MRGPDGYRLADEPDPSALARYAVNPFWPFLALMLGPAFVAWPWFALNAFAIGSPTRRRELALAGAGFFGAAALASALLTLLHLEIIGAGVARYAVLLLVVFKLGVGYAAHTLQSRTFPLYLHFGGTARSGAGVVGAAFVARLLIWASLPLFWRLVLG